MPVQRVVASAIELEFRRVSKAMYTVGSRTVRHCVSSTCPIDVISVTRCL